MNSYLDSPRRHSGGGVRANSPFKRKVPVHFGPPPITRGSLRRLYPLFALPFLFALALLFLAPRPSLPINALPFWSVHHRGPRGRSLPTGPNLQKTVVSVGPSRAINGTKQLGELYPMMNSVLAKSSAEVVMKPGNQTEKFHEALRQWAFRIQRDERSPILEQSSARFTDFEEPPTAMFVPSDTSKIDANSWKFCDPLSSNFTEELDTGCAQYLGNHHNILSIRPMESTLSFARTIKFRAVYRHGNPPLEAIIKVPQKKFLFEPYSEYLSWKIDRILGTNRVPPTAWGALPVTWLMAAASVVRHQPAFYAQWLNQFVFEFPEVKPTIKTDPITQEKLLPVSYQLWMRDVHNLFESVLGQEAGDSYQYFPVGLGSRDISNISPEKRYTLGEISDMHVFDFIITNQDRSLGKNTYVHGSCTGSNCQSGTMDPNQAKTSARFLYLDQGSSFYKRPPPAGNPLTPADGRHNSSFCRFRRSTATRLLQLVPTIKPSFNPVSSNNMKKNPTLWNILRSTTPPEVIHFVHESRVAAAQTRLERLLWHIRRWCLRLSTENDVLQL